MDKQKNLSAGAKNTTVVATADSIYQQSDSAFR